MSEKIPEIVSIGEVTLSSGKESINDLIKKAEKLNKQYGKTLKINSIVKNSYVG